MRSAALRSVPDAVICEPSLDDGGAAGAGAVADEALQRVLERLRRLDVDRYVEEREVGGCADVYLADALGTAVEAHGLRAAERHHPDETVREVELLVALADGKVVQERDVVQDVETGAGGVRVRADGEGVALLVVARDGRIRLRAGDAVGARAERDRDAPLAQDPAIFSRCVHAVCDVDVRPEDGELVEKLDGACALSSPS